MLIKEPLHGKEAPNVGSASKNLVKTKLDTDTAHSNSKAAVPQTSSKKK